MSNYKGSIGRRRPELYKPVFDWKALGLWVLSFIISLLPVYIAVLNQIRLGEPFGTGFWFKCYGEHDVLWVFGTVLLFCCFNNFAKNANSKGWVKFLAAVGIFIFVVLEITWYVFKYQSFENTPSEGLSVCVTIGSVLIIAAMVISTPLQIDFIKSEGK